MDDHPTKPAAEYEPKTFDCPRCEVSTTRAFYGPCDKCTAELRATQGAEPSSDDAFEKEAFEPQMNVVPNQIATKE